MPGVCSLAIDEARRDGYGVSTLVPQTSTTGTDRTVNPRPMIVGPLGPTQLSCLTSWRARGLQTVFLQTEDPPNAWGIGHLAHVHLHKAASALRSADGARWLREQVLAHDVSGVTCVGDELALWLHEALAPLPQVSRWLAPARAITDLLSKRLQIERASACGFKLLPTWDLRSADDVRSLPRNAYPVVARPDTPQSVSPGFKVEVWRNSEQAESFMRSRQRVHSPVIVQRFVRGPNVLVHGCRHGDGSQQPYAAFTAPRKHLGVCVELTPRPLSPELEAACRRFADVFALQGVFHFDLLLDEVDGSIYFMEVNARLGGTTGKVAALGLDEPSHLLSAFGALPMSPTATPAAGRAYNLQAALKYWWAACRGRLSLIDYPCLGTLEATQALLRMMASGQEEIGPLRQPRAALCYHSQKLAGILRLPGR
ncbi:MAG: hypothetical protein LC119_03845 [Burkholderiales bacterium]|nr:hypothetical protein [Burkholderiales bacterium]